MSLCFQANGITANLPPSSAPSSMSPGGMGSAGVGVNMSPGLVMLEEGKPDTSVAYKQWLYGLDLCEFMFHDGLLDRLVGSFIFYTSDKARKSTVRNNNVRSTHQFSAFTGFSL